jgi:uncharacterized repeat protein (TIGR01451 family)
MVKKTVLGLFTILTFTGLARANINPILTSGPTPSGASFVYTYTAYLSSDERLDPGATNGLTCPGLNSNVQCNPAGTFFTIYDVAGFQGVQGPLPANWTFSIHPTGLTPSTIVTNSFDSASLVNVTFTYSGPVFAPGLLTSLGSFQIISSLGTVSPVGHFSSQATNNLSGPANGNTDQIWGLVTVPSPLVPDLTITKIHHEKFFQGETGANYTIIVTNIGTAPTSGPVTVTDTLPSQLIATAISGLGWLCDLPTLTCTRSDLLTTAASYAPILLMVDVANGAPAWVTNVAAVSGGGDAIASNNTASDLTAITQTMDTLLINYFAGASGARPDQTVRITNTGTANGGSPAATLDLCANIYVFRADQQLAACCSCLTTPNGLRTLSVDFDLTRNPLTGGAIGEGIVKIVSSPVSSGGICTSATAGSSYTPLPALRAWGVHNQDVSGGLNGPGVVNAVTETGFSRATLSAAELDMLQSNCGFIVRQGSGQGICTCGRGD